MPRATSWSGLATRHIPGRCQPAIAPTYVPSPAAPLRCHRDSAARPDQLTCAYNISPYSLINRHAHIVHAIAAALTRRRNLPLSEDELKQCGHIALLELTRRDKPLNEALIWQRVRGSMLDACRREGWYGRRQQDGTTRRSVTLLEPAELDLRTHDSSSITHQERERLHDTLRDALATLPELDQAILIQHDLDQVPLRELARSMRRAPSRLSHRRSAALSALRRTLESRGIRSSSDLI